MVDAYALTLAALLLTTGSLADLYGRRRLFMIGLVIFSVSSLLSGLAADPLLLNLARGAQGVGGAAMFSTSLALLGSAFQGRERGTAFGVWGAITGLAVAIGPVVGGALTTGLSWRWIFLVNVPIGVVAVVITVFKVDESRQPGAQRPDIIGLVTFSGALGALIYALIKGNAKGWGSTEIIACLIGSAVLLIVFLVAEMSSATGHVRPQPVSQADLHRRADRRVRAVGRAVRAVPLPDALPAGHAGVLGASDRPALPRPVGRDPAHLDRRGPGDRDRADPVPDRSRPR